MACTGCKKKTTIAQETAAEVKKSDLQFQLRDGVEVAFSEVPNTKVTDKVILDFLRVNPNRISLFKNYPADWREQLNNKKISKSK